MYAFEDAMQRDTPVTLVLGLGVLCSVWASGVRRVKRSVSTLRSRKGGGGFSDYAHSGGPRFLENVSWLPCEKFTTPKGRGPANS